MLESVAVETAVTVVGMFLSLSFSLSVLLMICMARLQFTCLVCESAQINNPNGLSGPVQSIAHLFFTEA